MATTTAATVNSSVGVTNNDLRSKSPILLFDIMDTVVTDPFYTHMASFFGMTFQELLSSKHPTAWGEFERGEITEDQLFNKFFTDGRTVDGNGLIQHLVSAYTYINGMDTLLKRLSTASYDIHACSNYPVWHRNIEKKLAVSDLGLQWTFISCEGPMRGLRKPEKECYDAVVRHLGVDPSEVLLIDDRKVNVEGAESVGMQSILFEGAEALEKELIQRGLQF